VGKSSPEQPPPFYDVHEYKRPPRRHLPPLYEPPPPLSWVDRHPHLTALIIGGALWGGVAAVMFLL
jgi:hypothetical protein